MINAIVPIRRDSERLKDKNFLLFCEKPLYYYVLNTLSEIDEIDLIYIDTDCFELLHKDLNKFKKIRFLNRPMNLRGNSVTMNTLLKNDLALIEGEHFFQTHITNPLLTIDTIRKAIHIYFKNLGQYDSLFSVDEIKKRAYLKSGEEINHSNNILEQTQDLEPVFMENSNIFIFSRSSFFENNESRIGKKPYLFPMSSLESIDIDYFEDFKLAELIYRNINDFN